MHFIQSVYFSTNVAHLRYPAGGHASVSVSMAAGEEGARVSMCCAQPRPWAGARPACARAGWREPIKMRMGVRMDVCPGSTLQKPLTWNRPRRDTHTHTRTQTDKKPGRSEPVSHPCHLLFRTEKLHSTRSR